MERQMVKLSPTNASVAFPHAIPTKTAAMAYAKTHWLMSKIAEIVEQYANHPE
jgi:hypothetical protein